MYHALRRSYPVLYPVWGVLCALSFVLLADAPDPSRPTGRVTPQAAKHAALEHLRRFDDSRFGSYHVVDAGVYRDVTRGETIWIVLCDSTPRSGLRRAVVVDLDVNDGRVLRTRRPAGAATEDFPIP